MGLGGILKKLSPAMMLFGGGSDKGGAPAPKPATPAAPAANVESDEEKQKKALLAINAGNQNANAATLGVTSPATVTRRYLLGM